MEELDECTGGEAGGLNGKLIGKREPGRGALKGGMLSWTTMHSKVRERTEVIKVGLYSESVVGESILAM